MIRACMRCKHGIRALDPGPADKPHPAPIPFIVCTLMPPNQNVAISRPTMALTGFCGQFKLSVLAFLGHGPRA